MAEQLSHLSLLISGCHPVFFATGYIISNNITSDKKYHHKPLFPPPHSQTHPGAFPSSCHFLHWTATSHSLSVPGPLLPRELHVETLGGSLFHLILAVSNPCLPVARLVSQIAGVRLHRCLLRGRLDLLLVLLCAAHPLLHPSKCYYILVLVDIISNLLTA